MTLNELVAQWRKFASEALSEMSMAARGTPEYDYARIEMATWQKASDMLEAALLTAPPPRNAEETEDMARVAPPSPCVVDGDLPRRGPTGAVTAAERTEPDALCGCGYRQSLHHVDPGDGSLYCQIAKLRHAERATVPPPDVTDVPPYVQQAIEAAVQQGRAERATVPPPHLKMPQPTGDVSEDERAEWRTIIEHHRAMALRFAEDRDALKHENRRLKAELAEGAAPPPALQQEERDE